MISDNRIEHPPFLCLIKIITGVKKSHQRKGIMHEMHFFLDLPFHLMGKN